jgi:polyisoprenoid-binding protein YceI
MTRTRAIVVAIVALFAIGGLGLWVARDQFLSGDSVPELTLPSAAPTASAGGAATADPVASDDPGATASASAAAPGGAATPASLAGDWTIVTDASTAGYRVRERLAQLDADSDAVGRTSTGVTGTATLTVSGDTLQVTATDIAVDTTTIASDRSQRDNRMRDEGLQTDTFSTASFTLTTPVDVPAEALTGAVVDVTLHGDLTLHGVTKTVDIPAKAQLADGQIQIQGAITFPLSDYDITAPNIGGFIISIADEGTLEFLVTFAK